MIKWTRNHSNFFREGYIKWNFQFISSAFQTSNSKCSVIHKFTIRDNPIQLSPPYIAEYPLSFIDSSNSRVNLDPLQMLKICFEIVQAVNVLHQNNFGVWIIYRNNIILTQTGWIILFDETVSSALVLYSRQKQFNFEIFLQKKELFGLLVFFYFIYYWREIHGIHKSCSNRKWNYHWTSTICKKSLM